MLIRKIISSLTLCWFIALTGCSQHQQISPESLSKVENDFRLTRPIFNKSTRKQTAEAHVIAKPFDQVLSSGDKVMLNIHSNDEITGIYTIDLDGFIKLPYIHPLLAQGLTLGKLAETIKKALIVEQIFKPDFLNLTITPAQWSAAYVSIQGAVYQLESTLFNEGDFSKDDQKLHAKSGDFAIKRLLSSALKAAGGLRPDADMSNIMLVRNQQQFRYDLSGIITGEPIPYDPILVNGDQIIVPSIGYLQKELFQLSRVTPPGFRVFLSNLTVPAASNNTSAIGKYSSSLPLGSRLLTAAISANCVGGTPNVNAERVVVLAGKNIKTNLTEVMHKKVSDLLAYPNSDSVNPYLLPNDLIACFDSSVTDWRDIGKAISDILSPLKIISGG